MASKTVNRRVNIYINGKEVINSGKAIRAEWVKARNELNNTNKSAKEYQDRLKRFKDLDSRLRQHRQELSGVSRSWTNFKQIAAGVLVGGGIIGGIQMLGRFVKGMVTSNAELSDSLADVRKTTGLTAEEVDKLAGNLKKIDTRTSRKELLNLAKEAGKLGLTGVKNIEDFVKQADQIQVALGEDLGDGAVTQIGKIASAFGTDLLNIGSAINEVGANSKATEAYLVEFTARMQGVGVSTNLSASDIMGFAATLDSLGLQSEMSATALNTFFMDFVKDTDKFGEAAGFAEGELQKLIGKEGTNAGFLAFIQKLKDSSTGTKDFLKKMEDLGINGARGAQVFLALSNNVGEVAKMQGIANDAFEKGTSLTEEFNIKNNNLAANMEKVGRALKGMFTNSAIMKGIENVVGWFSEWVEIPLSETLAKEVTDLRMLELKIYDVNTPTEERLKLIKELQSQYPNYLANIDAETVSNEDLHKALEKVNQMLVAKLVVQKKQEEIDKVNEEAAQRILDLEDQKEKIREKMVKYSKSYELDFVGSDGKGQFSLYEQAKDLQEKMIETNDRYIKSNASYMGSLAVRAKTIQEDIDKLNKEAINLTEEKNRLAQELGLTVDESIAPKKENDKNKDGDEENNDNKGGGSLSNDEKSALDKKHAEVLAANEKAQEELNKMRTQYYLQQLSDEETMEKEKIRIQLENDIAAIEGSVASEALKREQIVAAKDLTEQAIQQVSDKYEAMREEKRKEKDLRKEEEQLRIQEALMSDLEYRLYQEEQYWDDLIALAEVGSAEYEALLAAKTDAINGIVREAVISQGEEMQKTLDNVGQAAAGFGNMFTGMMQLVGAEGEQLSEFQKAMALFQIGIDTASAISSALKYATANPANAVTAGAAGAVQFATQLGMIFANMAKAKKLIAGGDKPKYATGGIFDGPLHSQGGMPIIDPLTGMPVAEVEGGEAILSRSTVQNNRGLVDALLDTSMNRGGAALPFLQAENQRGINFDGLSVNRPFGSAQGTATQQPIINIDSQQIASAVASQIAPFMLEMRDWKRNLNATVNLKQMDDARHELDYIKSMSGMGS